jgi:hypothetical protein
MAKSKRPIKRSKIQLITNEPRYLLVGSYLTKKGEIEMAEAITPEQMEIVNTKYRKNRYKANPACTHVVRIISHSKFV